MQEKRGVENASDAEHARKLQRTDSAEGPVALPADCKQQQASGDTPAAAGSASARGAPSSTVAAAARSSSSSDTLQPLKVRYAVSSDKGTRTTMEDVHVCVPAQEDDPDNSNRIWYFALFDGHGGVRCATFASQRLHSAVIQAGLLTPKGQRPAAARAAAKVPGAAAVGAAGSAAAVGGGGGFQLDVKAAKQAVVQGFTATDQALLQECKQHNWFDGATCVAVWLVGHTALVANVGDAKCVLARRPENCSSTSQRASKPAGPPPNSSSSHGQLRAVVLTKDHLAMYPEERTRIEKAGGHVTADGRLNGRMQVSRSFGDTQFKGSGCSAVPAVTAFSVGAREAFLLCGCDGFFSVMDPQGAVDLVAQQLQQGKDPKAATNRLLHEAVTERRCKDNCSVMLVVFSQQSF